MLWCWDIKHLSDRARLSSFDWHLVWPTKWIYGFPRANNIHPLLPRVTGLHTLTAADLAYQLWRQFWRYRRSADQIPVMGMCCFSVWILKWLQSVCAWTAGSHVCIYTLKRQSFDLCSSVFQLKDGKRCQWENILWKRWWSWSQGATAIFHRIMGSTENWRSKRKLLYAADVYL